MSSANYIYLKELFRDLLGELSLEEVTTNRELSDMAEAILSYFKL